MFALVALVYLGTDFHETSLVDLEKLERVAREVVAALAGNRGPIDGAVVLGTCNRFEIYVEADSFHDSVEYVTKRVAAQLGIDHAAASLPLKALHGRAVPQHLFAVSAGLESMIVGEEEISGQVKRALLQAQAKGIATKNLNTLFQRAATVSKKVTSETGLGSSGRSIITTALDLAIERLGGLDRASVLLVGTGAYSRVVNAALARHGVTDIAVYSRAGRAEHFSLNRETTPLSSRGELLDWLSRADLVVSASGAHGYAIDRDLVRQALGLRQPGHPLVLIDVSLSRDIDPEVAMIPECEVIDLELIRDRAPKEHVQSMVTARDIILDAVNEFERELLARSIDPVVAALRDHIAKTVDQEVASVWRKFGDAAAADVRRSLHRVTNTLLHTPTVNAKELASAGKQDEFIRAVRLLFGIEVHERV